MRTFLLQWNNIYVLSVRWECKIEKDSDQMVIDYTRKLLRRQDMACCDSLIIWDITEGIESAREVATIKSFKMVETEVIFPGRT